MRKGLLFVVAALLVVALPLSASAGTQIYKAQDREVDLWEFCPYYGPSSDWFPTGPQQEFGVDVYIRYVGTEKFNARVKNADVGWNRNVHGTAYVYNAGDVTIPGDGGSLVSAMSALSKVNVRNSAGSMLTMYPFSCVPASLFLGNPDPAGATPLYSGPFQVEEVLQDDAGDFGCFDPADPKPVNFQDCFVNYAADFSRVDYLMYHGKLTGNRIYFWKSTIHQPGILQLEDKKGYNTTWTY